MSYILTAAISFGVGMATMALMAIVVYKHLIKDDSDFEGI